MTGHAASLAGEDGTRAGQVLFWSPQGVGDFADLAWVLAEVLGNSAGVRGMDVHRSGDGRLHAWVSCEQRGYVDATATRLGWSVTDGATDGSAQAWGLVGDLLVNLSWTADNAAGTAATTTDCGLGVSS